MQILENYLLFLLAPLGAGLGYWLGNEKKSGSLWRSTAVFAGFLACGLVTTFQAANVMGPTAWGKIWGLAALAVTSVFAFGTLFILLIKLTPKSLLGQIFSFRGGKYSPETPVAPPNKATEMPTLHNQTNP